MVRRTRVCVLLLAVLFAASAVVPAQASPQSIYSQSPDGNYTYVSQNDTGGTGLFAVVYDNFTLTSSSSISQVLWYGGYFPNNSGNITGWTLQFYGNIAGQPRGAPLYSMHVAGNGNETPVDPVTYSYTVGVNFVAAAHTTYWLAVVADLAFPEEWGWVSSTDGDLRSYQDVPSIQTRLQYNEDLAFTLYGTAATPEPTSFVLFASGLVGIGGLLRTKIR